jgi:hypothetical protein
MVHLEPQALQGRPEQLVRLVLMVPAVQPEQQVLVLQEPLVLQVLMALLELLALKVPLALAALSPLAPAQPTCCRLMAAARSPLMMRLPIRSSSGTTAQVSSRILQ